MKRRGKRELCVRNNLLLQMRIVECTSTDCLVVPIVLPHRLARAELPQAGDVVGRGSDEVGGIGREGGVPHPSLVAYQRLLERKFVA